METYSAQGVLLGLTALVALLGALYQETVPIALGSQGLLVLSPDTAIRDSSLLLLKYA